MNFNINSKKTFWWIEFNCHKAAGPLGGVRYLLIVKTPGFPRTHLIDLRRIRDWSWSHQVVWNPGRNSTPCILATHCQISWLVLIWCVTLALASFYSNICGVLRDLVPFVQLKNVKNTHRGALILVKLQASACNFNKSNTPPWVFFTFFKLCKWYQIAQRITYFLNFWKKEFCLHKEGMNTIFSKPMAT